ncbi:hypothetical protein [Varibaculum vaginae]|uniref:hypothetical protein n=1 Tax=Varibaculum vaginae TaxID=2364797 RepID=UPI000F098684|nr:hypothetical protein [Varibaculum vaginae]
MIALVIGICYLLLAAYLGTGLILFHRDHLPRGSRWGVVNATTTTNDNAWLNAHRAAAPLLGACAVICVVNGFAIAALTAEMAVSMQLICTLGTVIFTGIVYWSARCAATVSAKKTS